MEILSGEFSFHGNQERIHKKIANVIREAQQEEHDRIRIQHAKDLLVAHEEGFNAAREKAAEIAKEIGDHFMIRADRCCGIKLDELTEINKALGCKEVADRIRALSLQAEEKK